VWLLRSTRAWLPRDLEVLRPVFERMRAEGPDFLQRNAALGDEVRRTLADIDGIEGQLRKASTAIGKAQASGRNVPGQAGGAVRQRRRSRDDAGEP